ncbi:MAG: hypothetical protein ACREJ4_04985 [Candidatus Methylomirabilaceae bacterium]
MDDQFHRQAWEVLHFWIGVELENLVRIKAGIHSFTMPDQYKINDTAFCGWVTQSTTKSPDLAAAKEHIRECAAYLASQLYHSGDLAGAVRCALLLRHFFKDAIIGGTHDPDLHRAINKIVGGDQNYLFSGADSLNALIDQKLTRGTTHAAEGDTVG